LLVFHGFNVKNIGTSNEHLGLLGKDNRLDVIVDLNFVLPEISFVGEGKANSDGWTIRNE
jgi:hypothetical protein